jgi:hypothetical protein
MSSVIDRPHQRRRRYHLPVAAGLRFGGGGGGPVLIDLSHEIALGEVDVVGDRVDEIERTGRPRVGQALDVSRVARPSCECLADDEPVLLVEVVDPCDLGGRPVGVAVVPVGRRS